MVQPIKIYVGNVPQTARNSELKELFEKFGKVVECDILKEFAFVHMDDTNGAKAAIAGLNDSLWKGSRIRVELSTTKTSKGEPSHRFRNHEDSSIDRIRRRSSDRERDRDRRNYSSFSSSRANDPYPYKDERSLPYDRYGPLPHRLAKSDLGPIRESRYGSSSSSRGYLTERGRPYPDAYDRGLDDRSYPPMRSSAASRMYSGNYGGYASGPYRSGSPNDFSRDLRDSRGLEYSDPYMRPPAIGHYPPHGSYYRGPPIPPAGSSRYDYDHPSYGMPASSSRGSRYTPPSSYPVSSSSSSRHNYRSQNGTSPKNHSRDRDQNYLADYSYSSNGRHIHENGGSSSSKRRHQSSSPRPDYHSSSIQPAKGSSSHNGKSKEDLKIKISSRSSSSNVNSRPNGKKSNINRSDTPISSSPSSSNSSSPSYNSTKHETTNSSQSNRSSRRRKIDQEAKKDKSASTSPANLNLKKKSSSRHRSRSTSTRSRSRSSKRSARY